jgi:plastocyanin
MGGRASLAIAICALGLLCPAARAANQAVTATGSDTFSPKDITINQGDTVTWTNDGVHPHNVHFEEFGFVMPAMPSNTWSVQNTFMQPGTYHYYCEVHVGVGMSGTVVVNPAPAGGGGGPPGGPAPADTAPVASSSTPGKQRVGRLYVRASMNEAGTLAATGTVGVPRGAAKVYRFKRAGRTVAANQPVKLRLRLSKHALQRVRRALRKHKLRARVTLTATDMTGKTTMRKLTVLLAR